jgi:hypothetical protein
MSGFDKNHMITMSYKIAKLGMENAQKL